MVVPGLLYDGDYIVEMLGLEEILKGVVKIPLDFPCGFIFTLFYHSTFTLIYYNISKPLTIHL